ncbi:MAG: extracellular solute-binding protein [Caldilineaceae bacterium]
MPDSSVKGGWRRLGSLSVIFALLAVFILAACTRDRETPTETAQTPTNESSSEANVQPTPVPLPVTGKLTLWHSWSEADGDALAAVLDAFHKSYPDVTVDTLFVAYNDLPQSYSDAVLAGGGPDVMLNANWWLSDLVKAGVVLPLDDQVSPEQLAEYWPATVETLRRNGKLYGLPTNFETVSLFYNRSLITADKLPKNTDDLLKLAQESGTQGIGLYANLYHLYWGIPAYGAQLFDADGKIALDKSNGTSQYLSWLNTLRNTAGSFVDIDYGMLLDRYKKQEFAFFVDGPWALGELKGALGDNLAVTSLPAGPAGAAQPWLSADGVFLNPKVDTKQQQLALIFARFLTNAESGSTLASIAQRLPANRNAQISNNSLLNGFMQQAATATAIETRPEMDNVWGYGGDMIAKVLNGVSEPATAVSEATALINDVNGK